MNESFLKSDIFFFIASVGFILLTILLAVGLIYVLSILKTIRQISKTAKLGTETIVQGIQEAKNSIQKNSLATSFLNHLSKKLFRKHK